jgi:hypothetical protein
MRYRRWHGLERGAGHELQRAYNVAVKKGNRPEFAISPSRPDGIVAFGGEPTRLLPDRLGPLQVVLEQDIAKRR